MPSAAAALVARHESLRRMLLRRFAAYRVLRIAAVALPAIVAYRWLLLRERFGRPPSPAAWERVHDRAARGLHDLGIELAGFFVKLCQILGARADVVAVPFVRRLGRFHDAVPPRPVAEMRRGLEAELGRSLVAVFAALDETPLAAASLAQVHCGVLRDGSAVAVTIHYREVAHLTRVDLWSLRVVGRLDGIKVTDVSRRDLDPAHLDRPDPHPGRACLPRVENHRE